MKRKALFLCLIFSLMLALVSCVGGSVSEPKTIDELWARVNEKMDGLSSYEVDTNFQMKYEIEGYVIEATADGRAVYCNIGKENFHHYDYVQMTMSCSELSLLEKSTSIEAYNDGNMFYSDISDAGTQKFFSPITAEEYQEYINKSELDDDVFLDCTNKSFEKRDDGKWEIKYSGYAQRSLVLILNEMGYDGEVLDVDGIEDVEIIVIANKEFLVEEMTYTLIYGAGFSEEMTGTSTYSNFNTAEPVVEPLKVENYTKIADVRLLDGIDEKIKDIQNADDGKVSVHINQNIYVDGAKSFSQEEEDTILYGTKNGKYFYDIEADINGKIIDVEYKNGSQKITQDGEVYYNDQSEDEAKFYVNGLINIMYYDKSCVLNMNKVTDGTYKIECDVYNIETYENYFSSLGQNAWFESAEQTITVYIEDEKITKIESTVKALGGVAQGTEFIEVKLDITYQVVVMENAGSASDL